MFGSRLEVDDVQDVHHNRQVIHRHSSVQSALRRGSRQEVKRRDRKSLFLTGAHSEQVSALVFHWPLCVAHLDVLAGPHGPDRLQVLVSAAQHHAHGVVTLLDLRQSLLVAQSAGSVVG